MKVEHESGATAWLVGTLVAPSVQGLGLPLPQESCPIRVYFRASCSWQSEGLFGQLFSVALPVQALRGLPCLLSFCCSESQAHRGAPLAGVLSVDEHVRHVKGHPGWVPICSSAHWSLKGVPWVGPYFIVQCTRHLMGQPLYFSAANAGVWGERGEGDGSTHYV